MQAHLKALPRDHAAELEALVQRCFNTCANAHQLMSDADVYSMIEASIDKAQTSFQGSAEHWHHLVASCATSAPCCAGTTSRRTGRYTCGTAPPIVRAADAK